MGWRAHRSCRPRLLLPWRCSCHVQELQDAIGFPEYWREEARYAVLDSSGTASGSSSGSSASGGANSSSGSGNTAAAATAAAAAAPEAAGVEPDRILEPGASASASADASTGTVDLVPQSGGEERGRSYGARDAGERQPTWLRVKVTDARSRTTTLDTRFPAGA